MLCALWSYNKYQEFCHRQRPFQRDETENTRNKNSCYCELPSHEVRERTDVPLSVFIHKELWLVEKTEEGREKAQVEKNLLFFTRRWRWAPELMQERRCQGRPCALVAEAPSQRSPCRGPRIWTRCPCWGAGGGADTQRSYLRNLWLLFPVIRVPADGCEQRDSHQTAAKSARPR